MKTTITFDIDAQLKSEGERKARKQGTSLSTVLSEAAHAFIDDQLVIGIDRDIVQGIARAYADFEESVLNS